MAIKGKKEPQPQFAGILNGIAKGRIDHIYCVSGEETFFIDQLIAALEKGIFGGKGDGINLIKLNAVETGAGKIIDAVETIPFLGGRKMVVVRELARAKPDDLEKLTRHLEKSSDLTTLVLIIGKPAGKKPGRSENKAVNALVTAAKKHGTFINAQSPNRKNDLFSFVRDRADFRNVKIDQEAQAMLVDFIGAEITRLDNELEKLSLFVGEGGKIDARAVGEVSLNIRVAKIWDFTDAVADRKLAAALKILDGMIGAGENFLPLLAALTNHFRKLARLSVLDQQRAPSELYKKLLGGQSFKLEDFRSQLRRWSGGRLEQALVKLAELDRSLKSSRISDRLLFERTLIELLN